MKRRDPSNGHRDERLSGRWRATVPPISLAALAITLLLVVPSPPTLSGPASYAVPQPTVVTANTTGSGPIVVQSISAWSSLSSSVNGPYLFAPTNSTAVLVYPTWTVLLTSSTNVSFSVYVGGVAVTAGSVLGAKTISFGVGNGPMVSVQIGFGPVVYRFTDEVVATTTVATTPPPAPLVYSAAQYLSALLSGQVAAWGVQILAVRAAIRSGRATLRIRETREARRLL